MARILYALSGANRGHTSRVLAVTEELRGRGHEVAFCGGGRALEILEGLGERVFPVPAILQVMDGNRVRYWDTVKLNFPHFVGRSSIVARLLPQIEEYAPDLVVSDFEQYAPRAADVLGIPVLSFNHQQIVTETEYDVPARFRLEAFLTGRTINSIAPRGAAHVLVSSFFFPPVKDPTRTTLIEPIIRRAVREVRPEKREHVLVYINQADGMGDLPQVLGEVGAECVVYGSPIPADGARQGNLTFRKPSMRGFLEDLATSRGVICTAGYTLMSEALYLGKPLLVLPNKGTFEQTINAMFLEQDGLGEAVYHRPLEPGDVRGFLDRIPLYEARLPRRGLGNAAAAAFIEGLLHPAPVYAPRPAPAFEIAAQL
jgi:uncharacterized protein (TIGR00661 family)